MTVFAYCIHSRDDHAWIRLESDTRANALFMASDVLGIDESDLIVGATYDVREYGQQRARMMAGV